MKKINILSNVTNKSRQLRRVNFTTKNLFTSLPQPTEHKEIIIHLAKLADTITVPMARASILWLIGEYSDRVPKIAPDVLRKMAKTFINEVSKCSVYSSESWGYVRQLFSRVIVGVIFF